MLDDDEFKLVASLFHTGTEGGTRERTVTPALREYERITGLRETNPNALYHHLLSMGRGARSAENRKTKSEAVRVVCASTQHVTSYSGADTVVSQLV